MPEELRINRVTEADWPVIEAWAAAEGWNPGPSDGPCFLAQDGSGFFLGTIGDQPVSAISVVNYEDEFSFLGLYLVDPAYRGRGHGYATWQAALPHAGSRPIGLDGVVAQQDNYRRSGFELAYRNVRYLGEFEAQTAAPASALSISPVSEANLRTIAQYDTQCFPAERLTFLQRWLSAPGHRALAALDDGRVVGYGVIRPAPAFAKVGPLFADSPAIAEALFDALVATHGGGAVALDVPEPTSAAVALAEARGMKPMFETARMYTAPIREIALEKVFGVTTFELG